MLNKIIEINDENISYFQEEKKDYQKQILFFHGFASGKSILQKLIKIPNRNYAFVAMDMPGNGLSKTTNQQTLENYISIGQYFLDNLVEEKITLVGHSLGTIVAVALSSHPKVKNIILISAPNPWFVNSDPTDKINLLLPATTKQALKTISFIMHSQVGINIAGIANSFVQHAQEKRKIFTNMLATEILNPEYNQTRICTLFKSNNKPTILIYGAFDLLTPLEQGQDLSKRFGWKINIIKNVGHTPLFEDPKKVNEIITSTI